MLVAITGGIGSGKSVVSRILREMGYDVYDCDARARRLMDSLPEIAERISDDISREVIDENGTINRQMLAAIVFADADKLKRLNSIVHHHVSNDLLNEATGKRTMFFESAILYSSGFYKFADQIWEIDAPAELRIRRVMERNNATRAEVERRMASQAAERVPEGCEIPLRIIDNDGVRPLLPQIERLLNLL